jgi:dimethyl sulfoxide reductase membrane subunit
MATATKARASQSTLPGIIGLAVLVVIGIVAWGVQLSQGITSLGVGQAIVWGVYIATFFLLAGIAGGLMILASLSDLEVIPGLKSYRRGLLIGAVASFVAAGFMILMDIGRPERVLNMVFSANLSSPFVWDFACLALSVVVAAIYLYVGPKGKLLPILSGIVAALVIVVEGWILSMSAGGELWRGGMIPVLFLAEGLMAASAVVLIGQTGDKTSNWLRRLVLVLLPTMVVLNLLEMATTAYAGNPDAQAQMALYFGSLAPLFWGEVLLGIVVPFVLLGWAGTNRSLTTVAAVLAILGVFAAKLVVLVAGQSLPFMRPAATYTPTLVEIGGVVGILGLAGLLYVLGQRFIPAKA